MGIYETLETHLEAEGYPTTQGNDSSIPVEYFSGVIASFSEIEDLLSLPADFEDLDIALTNGGVTSLYGDETEFTLVSLWDLGQDKWCLCFKYADIGDYNAGKATQVPAVEERV
jgi:hypothetical protein